MVRHNDSSTLNAVYGKVRDRYLELIERFPLRPIRNDLELEMAIEMIDSLVDQKKLSKPESDYLDVLSDLVEQYEDHAIAIPEANDARMLKYLMELKELKQIELAKATGIAVTTISEVLSGKRSLTRQQVNKLAKHFQVGVGVFSQA